MLNRKDMKKNVVAAILSVAALASPAMAAEDGPLNYPAGSPGSMVGQFPPFAGLFMISQTSFSTSDALYDSNGDEIKSRDFSMDAWVETVRFVASYPTQLWGAHLYSQLVLPIGNVDSSLSVNTGSGSMSIFDEDDTALGNITVSPLIMNWTLSEHQYFTVGMDIALKQGGDSYDADSSVNVATGYNSIIPLFAYRYNDPQGLDIGAKFAYLINQENSSTDYDTGDMLAIDFTAGWNFGKLGVGIVGGYTDQLENDKQYGVEIEDSKLRTLTLGPSLTYSMGPVTINVNMQKGILTENSSRSDSYWINVALPLYVATPPQS